MKNKQKELEQLKAEYESLKNHVDALYRASELVSNDYFKLSGQRHKLRERINTLDYEVNGRYTPTYGDYIAVSYESGERWDFQVKEVKEGYCIVEMPLRLDDCYKIQKIDKKTYTEAWKLEE